MLTRDDLDEAVSRGILDHDQAAKLVALGHDRVQALRLAAGRDERFVFMRNFNELFVAIGCGLVSLGILVAVPSTYMAIGNGAFVVGLIILWGLAELLCRRLRLTLPSIVLAGSFVAFAGLAGMVLWLQGLDPLRTSWHFGLLGLPWIVGISAALLAAGLFYLRFRLPFALLLIAATATALLVASLNTVAVETRFTNLALLIAGAGSFTAAMLYDLSDRERLSRRADCAFWLHLIAGPLIVHSIIGSLWPAGDLTRSTALAILAVVMLFAALAVAVDRRALLVSSLAYVGITMSWGFNAFGSGSHSLLATFLVLGAGVIALGIGWQRVRGVLLDRLPGPLASNLPRPRP